MAGHTHLEKPPFAPLQQALQQLEARLAHGGAARVIVAAPTVHELKRRGVPEHVRMLRKKRRGPRVPVRGRRHYHESQLHLARWPEDGLTEGAVPSLACVLGGEADFNVADYALCCRAGDWVMFPAGVPKQDGSRSHFEGDPAGRFGDVLWIYTANQAGGLSCWISRSQGELRIKPPESQCRVEHRFLAQLFNGFCAEAMEPHRSPIIQHLLMLIVALLRDEIIAGNALKEWGKPRYRGKGGQSGPVAEALAYITENLDGHLTINKVARAVNLSPATFTRHFKAETGQTFQQYQTQRRMEVAEELLLAAERPVTYICKRVGLKYGQLWSLFQQRHGCSPSEFRERKKRLENES
jgi:AraC-like DNA-binding protein